MEQETPKFNHKKLPKERGSAPKAAAKEPDRPVLKKKIIATPTQINKQLRAIYKEADGSMPNMHHFNHGNGKRLRRFLLTMCALLILFSGAAWGGFFLFGAQSSSFSEQAITVGIDAPKKVTPGDKISYTIRVQNGQQLQLAQTELMVQYPEGFTLAETSLLPLADKKNTWRFGTLDGNEAVELKITGTLVGETGTEQSLRAFLTYKPSNFNSDFQTVTHFTHTFEAPSLSITNTIPKNASPGVPVPLEVVVENTANEPRGPLEIRINAIDQFVLQETDKSEKLPVGIERIEKGAWLVKSLEPQKKLTFKATGVFSPDAKETKKVVTTIAMLHNSRTYVLARDEREIVLQDNTLVLSLVANGSSSNLLVAPEDTLTFSLFYKNIGQKVIKNLTLKTILDVPSVQGKSVLASKTTETAVEPQIQTDQVNPDTRRIILTWTKKEINGLGSINTQKEDSIPFAMALLSKANIDYRKLSQFTIVAHAEGQFDDGASVMVQTQPITISIGSDTTLETVSEPVDPTSLESTSASTNTYRITWTIKNSIHALKNVTVKAGLVGDIAWLGQEVSGGSLVFDPKTKSVRWTIPTMDTTTSEHTTSFVIQLKAATSGQKMLMTGSNLDALDSTLNKSLLRSTASLSLP